MLELDYLVLADYVRTDSGVLHIMGAGIDTVTAPSVPTAHAVGIAARITFDTAEEPGTAHKLTITFQDDDQVLAIAHGTFLTPHRDEAAPVHWKAKVNVALRATLPLPRYGDYSLDVALDDQPVKSIDLRVVPPAEGA